MSVPLESIFSFYKSNQHNIVDETIKYITFKLNFAVNEIDSTDITILQNIENITFSFEYMGRITGAKSIDEFKSTFGKTSKYLEVDKEVKVIIKIAKKDFNKNNKFENFYFFSSYHHLEEKFGKIYTKFDWINNKNKLYIFCLCMDGNQEYQNDFVNIIPFEKYSTISEEIISLECLKKFEVFKGRNENNTITSLYNYPLSWMDNSGKSPRFLLNHSINLFIESISNEVSINKNILIKGYKNVYFEKDLIEDVNEINEENIIYTFKLINFLIDEDKFYDKLLIIRNNITLYLDSNTSIKDFLEKSKEIYKTVTHNFDLYIQNEIKVFLEQKNALLHEFISVSKQLGEIINDITAQLRNIGASLLGTVFIGLISDIDLNYSTKAVNLILLSYSIFFIINFGITFSHSKQFKSTKSLLENYTKTIAINNKEFNFKTLESEYLKEPSTNFKWIIISTRLLLICLIVIFVGCYISFNYGQFDWIIQLLKFLLDPTT